MASNKAVREILMLTVETYGGDFPSEALARFWVATLEDVEDEDLRRAYIEHARDPERGRFRPKPADLIAQLQKSRGPDVEAFVGECVEAIVEGRYRIYGPNGSFWDLDGLSRELGPQARHAFLEAGGAEGFDQVESAKFAAKRFGEILRRRLQGEARAGRQPGFDWKKLPPANELPELPADVSRDEASAIDEAFQEATKAGFEAGLEIFRKKVTQVRGVLPGPEELLRGGKLAVDVFDREKVDAAWEKLKAQKRELQKDVRVQAKQEAAGKPDLEEQNLIMVRDNALRVRELALQRQQIHDEEEAKKAAAGEPDDPGAGRAYRDDETKP